MSNSTRYLGIILLLVGGVFSCTDSSIEFEGNQAVVDWKRSDAVLFDFEVSDTTCFYDLSYQIRNRHDYPFCNLYLSHVLKDSTDRVVSRAFQNIMLYSPQSGQPLGKEHLLNDVQEGTYGIAQVKFDRLGAYKIQINHQMRNEESLSGIESVGLLVRKVEAE